MGNYERPTAVVRSIFDLDYRALVSAGRWVFLFDADNTLLPHGETELPCAVKELFDCIECYGGVVCVVSNNPLNRQHWSGKRTTVFHPKSKRHLLYFRKPMKRYWKRVLKILEAHPDQVVAIGDDYLRDVNHPIKMGMYGVLVNPIGKAFRLDRYTRRRKKIAKILAREFGINWPLEDRS